MELDTGAKIEAAFFRLVDTEADDPELTLLGEAASDVIDQLLTRGFRAAQRWMLNKGHQGWRKRSAAITWSGSDAANGGTYSALPADFMKAYGNGRMSCLEEANGDRWGSEIDPDEIARRGSHYYFRGSDDGGMQIWRGKASQSPATLYLDYHYKHPSWKDLADGDIDFPMEIRALPVAIAANFAKEEAWFPAGQEGEVKIVRALGLAEEEAMRTVKASRKPRMMRAPRRYGNHW